MSFITRASRGGGAAAQTATRQSRLTTSGRLRLSRDGGHLVSVDAIGGALIDLASSDPANLVVPIWAQGRYVLNEIVFFDHRGGDLGSVTIDVRTLDAARGGGRLLSSAVPLSALSNRKAAVRRFFNVQASVILSAPHLYLTINGTGTGTVMMRVIGSVVSAEDPEHPLSDPRRLG
ncbi:hypothetical protein NM680_10750 [Paracoccus sp. PS-1]|uniref:hypothetical protein n=1 Tax=Paracoccus sp. PS1 TaxID=2963938 RepID=UPI0027E5AB81|nr:hypothetical protein [Paracoccus sp. PS1]MDQ7262272.1 hypothetical protein [Paracoccus sp. PS1]